MRSGSHQGRKSKVKGCWHVQGWKEQCEPDITGLSLMIDFELQRAVRACSRHDNHYFHLPECDSIVPPQALVVALGHQTTNPEDAAHLRLCCRHNQTDLSQGLDHHLH